MGRAPAPPPKRDPRMTDAQYKQFCREYWMQQRANYVSDGRSVMQRLATGVLILLFALMYYFFTGCSEKQREPNNHTPMANTSGYASECDSLIDIWRNLDELNCQLQRNEMIERLLTQQSIIEALVDSLAMFRDNIWMCNDSFIYNGETFHRNSHGQSSATYEFLFWADSLMNAYKQGGKR